MNSMTDTPRIDWMEKMADSIADFAEMARTLERELTSAQAALAAKDREIERLNECLTAYSFGDVPKGWDDAIARAEKAEQLAREAMEDADHYKRIFKSNGASMELMASRIPTGGQVIDAVIRAAAVTADSPGVLVWSANAAEQIEAALAKIAEEGQAQP